MQKFSFKVVINRHLQNGGARYQTFRVRVRVADHIGSKFCFALVLVPAEIYVARKVFSEVSRKRFLAWICVYWYFNNVMHYVVIWMSITGIAITKGNSVKEY